MIVGAIVVVNAFGDVVDPSTGQILAGARPTSLGPVKLGGEARFADTLKVMQTLAGRTIWSLANGSNTVIGVVATNVKFDKAQATKVAQMAQDGVARTIRPAHTMLDGDTIFALATGPEESRCQHRRRLCRRGAGAGHRQGSQGSQTGRRAAGNKRDVTVACK